MQRILEPELMNDRAQALAYAQADFTEPHNNFIQQFKQHFPTIGTDMQILDLGCGPADISIRFAQSFTNCQIDALDGAEQMLTQAKLAIAKAQLDDRVKLIKGCLPDVTLPHNRYDVIISNSLLHHLHQPQVLWQSIKKFAKRKSHVLIMDLLRPDSQATVRKMVQLYASTEPQILQNDFYRSLCAAFSIDEIQIQLETAALSALKIKTISDRHVIIFGQLH